jgi:hypothetical protein
MLEQNDKDLYLGGKSWRKIISGSQKSVTVEYNYRKPPTHVSISDPKITFKILKLNLFSNLFINPQTMPMISS